MPRDSSGNYSLPAGNPVVTGSTIASSWANTTLTDIGNEITDSLDRSGKGAMLSVLKIVDGSVSAPGLSFGTEPGTGLYRVSASVLGFSITGTQKMNLSGTGLTVNGLALATSASVNGNSPPSSGQSIDLQYSAGGFLTAYDHTGAAGTPLSLRGSTISLLTGSAVNQTGLQQLASGAVTISAPSSTVNSLTITGIAGARPTFSTSPNTAGQSFGPLIQAGTNSTDQAFLVQSAAGVSYFFVRGDGIVQAIDDGGTLQIVGWRGCPINTVSSNYTAALSDRGKVINTGSNITITMPSGVFSGGDIVSLRVGSGATVTIAQGTGLTMNWAGNGGTTGSRTATGESLATVLYLSSSVATISGAGLT